MTVALCFNISWSKADYNLTEELLGYTYKDQASCKVGQGQSILWRHWQNISIWKDIF